MRKIYYKVTLPDGDSIFAKGRYCLSYEPGKVVRASSDTYGIFCFKTIDYANKFRRDHYLKNGKIQRILANELDEIAIPDNLICSEQWEGALGRFYLREEDGVPILLMHPPAGTICFRKIRVIGEVSFLS